LPVEAFRRLVPLWEHMTGIYGHKWASSYGEAVSPTWVRGCMDLTNDELAAGLRGCLKRSEATRRIGDDDWPPTLGEFRLLARPTPYPYRNDVPALPAPQRTPEQLAVIEADIARLRLQLKDDQKQQEEERRMRLRDLWRSSRVSLRTMLTEREPGSDDEPIQEGDHGQAA